MRRWLLLENNPALAQAGWLPPAAVWPELAPLRAEHERLLAIVREETAELSAIKQRHELEDAERGAMLTQAYLGNSDPGADERATEEARSTELLDALLRVEAAVDALVSFLNDALDEIQQRLPELYVSVERRRAETEAKVEEARRLLAAAEEEKFQVEHLGAWLDRESGESPLGHVPFDVLAKPPPEPVDPRPVWTRATASSGSERAYEFVED